MLCSTFKESMGASRSEAIGDRTAAVSLVSPQGGILVHQERKNLSKVSCMGVRYENTALLLWSGSRRGLMASEPR